MAEWADLDAELDLWDRAQGQPVFWWRDDDTRAPGAALDRLIALAEGAGAPLHLATIPQGLDPGLAARLEAAPLVRVLQHGYAHLNHEPSGTPPSEVGIRRPLEAQAADLRDGWAQLRDAGVPRLLPVFVPPWNRIAAKTVALLPHLGYRCLSTFHFPPLAQPVRGMHHVDAHIDPIRWKGGARFIGEANVLAQVTEQLRGRRLGTLSSATPVGLCTHHLDHDAETWAFCEVLLARLDGRARWVALDDVMEEAGHD